MHLKVNRKVETAVVLMCRQIHEAVPAADMKCKQGQRDTSHSFLVVCFYFQ